MMKNTKLNSIFSVALALLLAVLLTASCATKRPRNQTQPNVVKSPPTPSDSVPDEPPEEPVIPPKPPAERPPKVALLLGGAGVASFATVGLLKRFQQEGISVEVIIASGWPALFALSNGFMRSVHDLEWFAMRLKQEDFFASGGLFSSSNSEFNSHDQLLKLVTSQFRQTDLRQAKTPVYLAASSLHDGGTSYVSSGPWKDALMKAMSVPGIHRPYPTNGSRQWVSSFAGLGMGQGVLRRVDHVVTVDMYGDYFQHLRKKKVDSVGDLFRRLYQVQFQRKVANEMGQSRLKASIVLNRSPDNFSSRRQAIKAGYDAATEIIAQIRKSSPRP